VLRLKEKSGDGGGTTHRHGLGVGEVVRAVERIEEPRETTQRPRLRRL
jgi:hypothetical protein